MPTTKHDKKIIKKLSPGTKVRHTKRPDLGIGVVTNESIEYGQIPVRFENDLAWTRCYCYPINLMRAEKQRAEQEEK